MVVLLIITFLISYFIISVSKGAKNSFFQLPFIVTTPPLIVLIYYDLISNLNIKVGEAELIEPIFNQISFLYIKAILALVLIIYQIRKIIPKLVIAKFQHLPPISTCLTTYLIFFIAEFLIEIFDPSIHLKILFSEFTNLSLILLVSSLLINFKIVTSIFRFLFISVLSTFVVFIFTFDKGNMLSLFSSILLILVGSKNLNIKIDSLKTNLIILSGAFFVPFLNFFETYFLSDNPEGALLYLSEAMESTILTNFSHVFWHPLCTYNTKITLLESITSPIRAIFGMDLSFHQHLFMETCFPIERSNGSGRAFGLITESFMSEELPSFLYFSLTAIAFILIFEYFYYRFSLFGLLFYSQSIEIIYKLTRSDLASSMFSISYTLIAAFIVYRIILIINPLYRSKEN